MATGIKTIQVALADDHVLIRNSVARLVASFPDCEVLFEADNGLQVKEQLNNHIIPHVLLLDISMPVMDGFETALWISKNFPQIRILALTMSQDEASIVKMLRSGAKGFVAKTIDPEELQEAIHAMVKKDYYIPDEISGKLVSGLHQDINKTFDASLLSEKEKEFLKMVCTEFSYKEISEKMFVSPRTVDDYRATLFEKLKVHSRMGLAIYAIKNGLVEI
ncbi:response regulator [Chitinophagaceae bacterium LWZ2-11]